MPKNKIIVHAPLDPIELNKSVLADHALIGDAGLTLEALIGEVKDQMGGRRYGRHVEATREIETVKEEWLSWWIPKLTSDEVLVSPYCGIWDLRRTEDRANTIITRDAGSPRDQVSPFWEPVAPLSHLGWGKTMQLGYGLGLAMGAKLAMPEKLCVNVGGKTAIGFTGMDFETAVRERIPILSIPLDNFPWLRRASDSTRRDRSRDPVRDPKDTGRHSRLPGISHREGDYLLNIRASWNALAVLIGGPEERRAPEESFQ